jgi:hypothetical protein
MRIGGALGITGISGRTYKNNHGLRRVTQTPENRIRLWDNDAHPTHKISFLYSI